MGSPECFHLHFSCSVAETHFPDVPVLPSLSCGCCPPAHSVCSPATSVRLPSTIAVSSLARSTLKDTSILPLACQELGLFGSPLGYALLPFPIDTTGPARRVSPPRSMLVLHGKCCAWRQWWWLYDTRSPLKKTTREGSYHFLL